MKASVYCIATTEGQADRIVRELQAVGFSNDDISVLFPDTRGTRDLGHEKHTKAPEGAATGAGAGGVLGGTLGLLAGIGALAIPGVGPLIAAGPIVAALAGLGAVGTVGGIIGALVGMGIPEYEARRFEGRIRDGGALVSVHCDNGDWVKRAKEVMIHSGGQNIGVEGEKSGDFANADKPMPRARTATLSTAPEDEAYLERPVKLRTDLEPVVDRTTRIRTEEELNNLK